MSIEALTDDSFSLRAAPKLWLPEPDPNPSSLPKTNTPEAGEAPAKSSQKKARKANSKVGGKKPVAALAPALLDGDDPSPRYSPTIKELPEDERPRERLTSYGAQALSTSELIAILIRVGNAERSAVSLGEHLLAHFGNIGEVAVASVEQLALVKGVGEAKAAQIKAAIEFGKRVALFSSESRPVIGSPSDAANLLISDLRYLRKETFKSILLDTKNRVIAIRTVSIGDLSSSIVNPREVFKDAVIASSASIIVAHNHPSGDPTPSTDDISVTKRLISAGEILGIDVLDHLVIGDGNFVSLKERGLV